MVRNYFKGSSHETRVLEVNVSQCLTLGRTLAIHAFWYFRLRIRPKFSPIEALIALARMD